MAERADRDTVGDADAWSEDDIGLHHAVPPDNRIVREPHRIRSDQRHPVSHGLEAPPPLPLGLDQRQLRAAVDPRHLPRLGLDHGRAPPVLRRQHDDRSEEPTSELQSLMRISSAVFSSKKKTTKK